MTMSAGEAVANAYRALADAFQRGDADSISELYTDEAELFVPGAPVIEGRRAIREVWRSIVGSGGNTLIVEVREVQESGVLAYDTGQFTAAAPDGSVINTGKWIVIWERQSGGAWKIHRDFFHWDIAPVPATTP